MVFSDMGRQLPRLEGNTYGLFPVKGWMSFRIAVAWDDRAELAPKN